MLALLATGPFHSGDGGTGLLLGARGIGVVTGPFVANRLLAPRTDRPGVGGGRRARRPSRRWGAVGAVDLRAPVGRARLHPGPRLRRRLRPGDRDDEPVAAGVGTAGRGGRRPPAD